MLLGSIHPPSSFFFQVLKVEVLRVNTCTHRSTDVHWWQWHWMMFCWMKQLLKINCNIHSICTTPKIILSNKDSPHAVFSLFCNWNIKECIPSGPINSTQVYLMKVVQTLKSVITLGQENMGDTYGVPINLEYYIRGSICMSEWIYLMLPILFNSKIFNAKLETWRLGVTLD